MDRHENFKIKNIPVYNEKYATIKVPLLLDNF